MGKPRKPAVTNEEVINELISQGHLTQMNLDKSSEFCDLWKKAATGYRRWYHNSNH